MGMMFILGLVLSAAIGLSLGLIGGGGSIITLPVLIYALGVEPHQAIGMSLPVVGATSLIGSALHYRKGAVDLRTGALFGAAGIAGALAGARLTYLFSPASLLLIFATLMIVIAALMLTRRHRENDAMNLARRSPVKAALAGFAVGALTGFLGVGGGFLIVPALILFGGLNMKNAVGTSLFIIATNSVAGFMGHLPHGQFDWRLTLLITGLAVAGALAGARISHRSSPAILRKGFAGLAIAVAVFLIAKNCQSLIY